MSLHRITSVRLVLILSALLLAAPGCRAPRPQNVVLIVMDTTRADHIGSYGYSRETTPHLDRLAERSTLFEQAYSHSPWTMPSMASIFTSLPPRDHGIVRWEQPLPTDVVTLAEHLEEHELRTAAFVSHVIFQPAYNYNQGFAHYDDSVLKKGKPSRISSAKEISDLAIAWLEENSDEPFFTWLHYFDPHTYYFRHPEFDFGSEPIDRYDSEIRFTDEHIGRVLSTLDRLGLWDDTIVVFVADHGEEFLDHGGRRHSKTLYDELVRIPLTIYVPGFEPAQIETVVSESDLAPTLCKLLGLPVPEQFAGRPFSVDGGAFRVDSPSTVFMETLRFADKQGVRQGRWKLIHDRELETYELFDLEADPRERRNLFDAQRDVAAQLQEDLTEHYSKPRAFAEEQELSEELRKQLEALGYLQ